MRCCVPFCRNTPDNASTLQGTDMGITFHGFPNEAYLRAAWLRALGKQDGHLPDGAVVCSQHFLRDDIYETESGFRQIGTSAIPSAVQVCMICLDIDSKFVLMSKHNVKAAYEKLTGYPRLMNFSRFREQSLRARSLMMDLANKYELITIRHMKMTNRANYQLKCNFVSTMLGPDHCDLHIVEHPDEDIQTELEDAVGTVVVKNEGSNSVLVDENLEVKNEDDNHADNFNEEFIVTHEENSVADNDSTILGALPLNVALQRKPAAFQFSFADQVARTAAYKCTLCFEEFSHEHEYNGHMSVHLQTAAGDGDCETSQAREPRTAASSSGASSHVSEHKYAVQKLEDDSYPSDFAQTSVAPPSAIRERKKEIKVPPTEDADTYMKSERVHEIYDGESYKHSSGSNKTNANMNRYINGVVKTYDVMKSISSCDSLNIAGDIANENAVPATANTRFISKPLRSETGCSVNDTNKQFKNLSSNSLPVVKAKTRVRVKPIACKFCPYACKRKSALVRHMRTHTGEKPYYCELCDYKCAQNGRLVQHMKTHTGEKPYFCNLCEYKCALKFQLVMHMRTHTGEKPYSCKFCEYKCSRKDHLRVHMNTHTGEKPYSCALCEYSFSRKSNLTRHMRTHPGESL